MKYTNTALVAHCKKALAEGWFYLWGSFAQIATKAVIDNNIRQYPDNARWRSYASKAIGKTRVCDCYGLVKSFLWWTGDKSNPKYNAVQDINTLGAYNRAREKGILRTMPETPGLILYTPGHVGVYIGDGEFIECVGGGVGMRRGTIENGAITSGSRFTHWFKDTNITYVTTPTTESILSQLKEVIHFEQEYWRNAMNGGPFDPLYLKILINRLLGKIEYGSAISTENVLQNIKPYTADSAYWQKVLDGDEKVNPEWLRVLLDRMC
jgi:cell wall-associated NlpC family hydrolase